MNADDYRRKVKKTEIEINNCKDSIRRIEGEIDDASDAEAGVSRAMEGFLDYIANIKRSNDELRSASFTRIIGGVTNSVLGLTSGMKYLAAKVEFERGLDIIRNKKRNLEGELQTANTRLRRLKREKENYQQKYEEKLREEHGGGGRSF